MTMSQDDELKWRVRSQVACVRALIDELDRLRSASSSNDDDDDEVLKKGLTTQLFEEIERLEALLMEVEAEIVEVRREGAACSRLPSTRPTASSC